MSNLKVIKLGGTSQTLLGYSNLIRYMSKEQKYVIVVSAIKNITNLLIFFSEKPTLDILETIINKNNELLQDLKIKEKNLLNTEIEYLQSFIGNSKLLLQDKINIISSGETFTAKILNSYFNNNKFESMFLDSCDFINSDQENYDIYNKGEFNVDDTITSNFESKSVLVVPGFRGITNNKNICLMGRGGSDTTGSIISAKLNASSYEIWTDVNGIYSGDPNKVSHANIIPSISYDVAQEISAMGAKVIHPYCIKPCKEKNIPIVIRNTYDLSTSSTVIENVNSKTCDSKSCNSIYSITSQSSITIFKIKSLNMWNNYGFVYDIFSKFKDYNVDVNIINTSQFDITTTTDDSNKIKLLKVKEDLEKYYNVEIITNCTCISLVGENIRKFKKLNCLINAIGNFDIKLTSYSSNDMSLSFVVEDKLAKELLNTLHCIAFPFHYFKNKNLWWNKLLNNPGPSKCQYMYSLNVINRKIKNLLNMNSIDRIYYAMKANNNSNILKHIISLGIGIETVSVEEIDCLLNISNNKQNFGKVKILYTPNFADIEDYKYVKSLNTCGNIKIIIDNINILRNNPKIFKDMNIGLRLDLDYGFGHCTKVITQGQDSKFGMTYDDIINNVSIFTDYNIRIEGLHSHMGSGITNYKHWIKNLNLIIKTFNNLHKSINNVKWVNIGGGFGIDNTIDFELLNEELINIKRKYNFRIFIEPGRYIVAESGIILGKVTQIKYKNNTKFIGTNIGMTDLIRPALYSSIHPIYFKDNNKDKELVTVVGPICESGDVLLKNLLVEKNIREGDSIVVTNTGAYGHVMASQYNNRLLPIEIIIN